MGKILKGDGGGSGEAGRFVESIYLQIKYLVQLMECPPEEDKDTMTLTSSYLTWNMLWVMAYGVIHYAFHFDEIIHIAKPTLDLESEVQCSKS